MTFYGSTTHERMLLVWLVAIVAVISMPYLSGTKRRRQEGNAAEMLRQLAAAQDSYLAVAGDTVGQDDLAPLARYGEGAPDREAYETAVTGGEVGGYRFRLLMVAGDPAETAYAIGAYPDAYHRNSRASLFITADGVLRTRDVDPPPFAESSLAPPSSEWGDWEEVPPPDPR